MSRHARTVDRALPAVIQTRDGTCKYVPTTGQAKHRAIRQHAYVEHPRGEDFGCNRPEGDGEPGRCGFYRKSHPTMTGVPS